jgi:hypothetical protein
VYIKSLSGGKVVLILEKLLSNLYFIIIECAILSPRFAIQERKVKNVVPFSVLVGRQPSDFPIDGWKDCNYETLFPVWSELGKTKSITFKKPKSLRILLV